jgi:hypothetical protein
MTRAALALTLALVASTLAADEPRARKLDGGDVVVPPEVVGEPGRPLPRTIAICHDAAARRCWTAPTEPECAPRGTIYRVVIDDADEVADALDACRKPPPR